MYIADGEIALAKELGKKLLKANPHDHDYLLGVKNIAQKMGDERWVVEIQEIIERERKTRPWEIALFTGESS